MLDSRHTLTELLAAAARLCKAFLGIEDEEVGPEWKHMAKLALEERARVKIGPRRTPSERMRTAAWNVADPHPIDNRMVWRLVLDGGGVPDRLRPAVLTYFGCLHGTGSVERGLGRDKRAAVEPHVGSLRPSAKVEEDNSKCLELHREGPRREDDLSSGVPRAASCSSRIFREPAQRAGWRRMGAGSARSPRAGRTRTSRETGAR